MSSLITLLTYIRCKYFRNFKNRHELTKYQQKRFKTHLKKVKANSVFYANFFKDAQTLKECTKTINKQIMMDNFDLLNTVNVTKQQAFSVALQAETDRNFSATINHYTVGLSSGTSGNRGLFLVSPKEEAIWAGVMLAKCLPDPLWKKNSIALFLRANSKLYEKTDSGRIQFSYFDLLNPIADNLSKLATVNPSIIVAPPSVLRQIAEAIIEETLSIQPKKIISVAEVLDPLDEAYLIKAFKQPIEQIYQATEGFIGHTCSHGTLHLNEDILIVERDKIEGSQNKFIPIISDLYRETQPIIRYRLNDILTIKEDPCPCGSPFLAIEQVEGRCDDIFYIPSMTSHKLIAILPDFIRRAIISASDEIKEYTIKQITNDELTLSILINSQQAQDKLIGNAIIKNLESLWVAQDCLSPIIKFVPYEKEQGLKKLRRVQRSPEVKVDWSES